MALEIWRPLRSHCCHLFHYKELVIGSKEAWIFWLWVRAFKHKEVSLTFWFLSWVGSNEYFITMFYNVYIILPASNTSSKTIGFVKSYLQMYIKLYKWMCIYIKNGFIAFKKSWDKHSSFLSCEWYPSWVICSVDLLCPDVDLLIPGKLPFHSKSRQLPFLFPLNPVLFVLSGGNWKW